MYIMLKKSWNPFQDFIRKYSYQLVYLLLISLFFLCLELKYPFYFFQDDNRGLHFPLFVHNLRAILSGEIPLYNFHQSLGIPELAGGLSAPLYPVTYASLIISKLLFGHYYAGVDIQAIFHLIFGGLGLFILLKELSLDGKSALFAALTYPLCSFNLYTSNAWIVIGGPIAYFPWMIFLGVKLMKTLSRKHYILLILARLMVAFVGHTQYFIYSVLLEIITVILLSLALRDGKSLKQLLRPFTGYLFSLVATAILSLPLHLPMLHQMTISFSRSASFNLEGLMEGGLFFPEWIQGLKWPFAFAGDSVARLHDVAFIGLATLVFIAEAVIAILTIFLLRIREKNAKDPAPKKAALSALIFLGAGFLCFCWAFNIVIPYIIQYIPVLNRFRWPYKLQLFLSFYLIAAAGCGFYLFFKKLAAKKFLETILVISLIFAQLFTFHQLYVKGVHKSGRLHLDPVPLEEPLRDKIKDGRLISVGYDIADPYTINSIGFNYASLWGLYQMGGYDPIKPLANFEASFGMEYTSYYDGNLNKEPEEVEYLRGWGVKWYVVHKDYVKRNGELEFTKVYSDERRVVYRDDRAKPFFYWESNQSSANIDSLIKTNSIRLEVNHDSDDQLIINFMYNPFFSATLDGKKLDIKNSDGRISVSVPGGNHTVKIRYWDPYFGAGCYLAFLYIAGTAGLFFLDSRFGKRLSRRIRRVKGRGI